MTATLKQACDAALSRVVAGQPRLPGVVAMVTDGAGTLYAGTAGERVLGSGVAMTTDTVFAMFSATKAIAATAVLQLAEDGQLDLDAPAQAYVPEIGQLEVLEGFDADGKPLLRAPKRDITTRMLLLHTAGFANDVFNETYLRLRQTLGLPTTSTARKASLMMPLLFDPGERWEYGSGIDWAGQVLEAIAGKRLGDVLQERVFAPLGMTSTAFSLTPSMRERLARVHQRGADASLEPLMNFEPVANREMDMGGSGLYGTVEDYIRFIRMWLNDGMGEHGRVLKPETVAMAVQNGLGDKKIKALPGMIPSLSHTAEFFPGMPKSWALSFMVNDEPAPTGRPAGALAWAGLANCYFWIDRTTQIGGFWATQVLPFVDATAIGGYLDFETSVYDALPAGAAA